MRNFKETLTRIRAFAFDVDGVLSRTVVPMFPSGEPMRTANIKDGYALQLAVRLGYPVAIITGGATEAIRVRFRGLGIEDIFMGQAHKIDAYNQWKQLRGLKDDEILYMGDDMPDLPIMRICGAAACPADAVRDIKEVAHYVSPCPGGEQCARDVIEQVLRVHGQWGKDLDW